MVPGGPNRTGSVFHSGPNWRRLQWPLRTTIDNATSSPRILPFDARSCAPPPRRKKVTTRVNEYPRVKVLMVSETRNIQFHPFPRILSWVGPMILIWGIAIGLFPYSSGSQGVCPPVIKIVWACAEHIRGVKDSVLESAPEYEFGSFLAILDGDSGSGSFLVWSRFQHGIGSTSEAGTKFPCWRLNIHNFGHICLSFCLNKG